MATTAAPGVAIPFIAVIPPEKVAWPIQKSDYDLKDVIGMAYIK